VSKDQAKTSRNAAQEQAKASWRATWLQKLKNRSTGTTATNPMGIAVSQALALPARDQANAAAIKHAVDLIDQVHGDGVLPASRVLSEDLGNAKYGDFLPGVDGARIRINSSETHDHPIMTTLHEVGHFLDDSGLPGANYTTESHPELVTQWRKAVYNSQQYKALKEPGMDTNGYLRKDNELFARSYAQFIAVKSGDIAALKELTWMREHEPLKVWDEQDFKPIAIALEALCKKQKWLA
jgi:hypothetical protein